MKTTKVFPALLLSLLLAASQSFAYQPINPNGQATSANSQPVVLPSDGTLPLPTGASTSANQTSANTSLSSIVTNTANIPAKGQALGSGSTPVTLSAPNVSTAYTFTRPVSVTPANYTVGNAVTDSTTPMSWAMAPANGVPVYLTSAIVKYQTSGGAGVATTATLFRIHYFGQSPTIITDDTAFSTTMTNWCGYMDVQLVYQGTDWTIGIAYPVNAPYVACKPAGGSTTIYGLMEAKATFAKTASGIFSVQPIAQ